MPKYTPTPELQSQLADPIEFTIKGREFRVDIVPASVIAELARMTPDQQDPGASILATERILEAVIGTEIVAELRPIDARELFPLVTWLANVLKAGMGAEEKNGSEK